MTEENPQDPADPVLEQLRLLRQDIAGVVQKVATIDRKVDGLRQEVADIPREIKAVQRDTAELRTILTRNAEHYHRLDRRLGEVREDLAMTVKLEISRRLLDFDSRDLDRRIDEAMRRMTETAAARQNPPVEKPEGGEVR